MPIAKKQEIEKVSFPEIEIEETTIKIVGTSSLVVHNFSDKHKQMMLEKQTKTAKTAGKTIRNVWEDVIGACYWLTDLPTEYTKEAFEMAVNNGARFGFPTVGFKASVVSAAYRAGWVKNKVSMNGMFHIDGDLIEICGVKPIMREDAVKLASGVTDLRFRPEFPAGWYSILNIKYVSQLLSLNQLVNAINYGGFAVGIGENRIEKGGTWGAYRIE